MVERGFYNKKFEHLGSQWRLREHREIKGKIAGQKTEIAAILFVLVPFLNNFHVSNLTVLRESMQETIGCATDHECFSILYCRLYLCFR